MTYNVFGGMLNPAQPTNQHIASATNYSTLGSSPKQGGHSNSLTFQGIAHGDMNIY